MVASIPAAWVTEHKGRKASMLVASTCYIIGSIIVTAAVHISMLIIGRIFLGIGVGFAIQVFPAPLSTSLVVHISRIRLNITLSLL